MYKKTLIIVFTILLASAVHAADSTGFNKAGDNVKIVITPSMGSPCDDELSYNNTFILKILTFSIPRRKITLCLS